MAKLILQHTLIHATDAGKKQWRGGWRARDSKGLLWKMTVNCSLEALSANTHFLFLSELGNLERITATWFYSSASGRSALPVTWICFFFFYIHKTITTAWTPTFSNSPCYSNLTHISEIILKCVTEEWSGAFVSPHEASYTHFKSSSKLPNICIYRYVTFQDTRSLKHQNINKWTTVRCENKTHQRFL